MWTTLSVKICLLTLAAVMLFPASEVDAFIALPCCYDGRNLSREPIKACYEQKPRDDCDIHAFLLQTVSGELQCINRKSRWLKKKLKGKQIKCVPAENLISKFKVLADVAA